MGCPPLWMIRSRSNSRRSSKRGMCACVCLCMCLCMNVCMYVLPVYVYAVYVCVCVCICGRIFVQCKVMILSFMVLRVCMCASVLFHEAIYIQTYTCMHILNICTPTQARPEWRAPVLEAERHKAEGSRQVDSRVHWAVGSYEGCDTSTTGMNMYILIHACICMYTYIDAC